MDVSGETIPTETVPAIGEEGYGRERWRGWI
jgi:hypothetical protein